MHGFPLFYKEECFRQLRQKGGGKRTREPQFATFAMHLLHLIFSAQEETGASPPALQNSSGSISFTVTEI